MESDEALMSRCRDGNADAFAQIEARYRPLVWSMCKRILSYSGVEIDEATHEAFVKLWLSRAKYSPERPFRPWLKAITFKTCMDHLRLLGRLREVPISARDDNDDSPSLLRTLEADNTSADHAARLLDLKRAFSQCWSLLPGHQRAFIQFIDWSDWKGSSTAVASVTGRSPAAVRITTIRYVRELVNCLREKGFQPKSSELLEVLEQSVSIGEQASYESE